MKIMCFFLLSLCPLISYGQRDTLPANKVTIYRTYQDFVVRRPIMSKDTFILKNDSKPEAPENLNNIVWGMQNGNGLFRFYNGASYLVEDTSGLIIYSISHIETEVSGHATWVPIPAGKLFPYGFPIATYSVDDEEEKKYFFSMALDGKIQELTEENVINAVNNPEFTKAVKKKFKWYNFFITDRENNEGPFLINEVYNQTIKK